MSKVTIAGDVNGTGVFTIAAPNGNTNRTLTLPDEAGTMALQGGAGVGKVLQVVSVSKTDVFSTVSQSYVDITGLAATITPSSATSKILCVVIGVGGMTSGTAAARLVRDSTPIQVGDTTSGYTSVSSASLYGGSTDGNNNESIAISVLDSPFTTSAVTYKVQLIRLEASGTVRINALGNDNSGSLYSQRAASNITLMEIAA